LQAFGERRTLHRAVKEQGFGLAIHCAFELGQQRCVHAQAGEFLQQRGAGLALCIQTDRYRHQLQQYRPVGGLLCDSRDMHREPAR
jgi:hypothetical protein